MAPVSVRKLIVAAIIARLKLITVLNGYNTDLNSRVSDWQLTNIPLENLPAIAVEDPSQESERRGSLNYNTLAINLEAKITASTDAARDLLADMVLCMAGLKPTLPEAVYSYLPGDAPELLPEEKDKKAIKVTMSYEIKYRE